jgi:hypothetical protein
MDILSDWHFVNRTFCQTDILSNGHFIRQTFLSFIFLPNTHLCTNVTRAMQCINFWNLTPWRD